jgi:hypothetical protein
LITSPAAASAALSGTAITLIPTGTGYVTINNGAYVPPVAPVALTLTDDSATLTPTLTTAFPHAGGSATALSVCSNGHVAVATGNAVAYAPDVPTMLNTNTQTAWYSWHDYNPSAVGSGQVKFEEIGTVAYITWDGVYNYGGTTAADATTMQFQFDSAVGSVTIAWLSVSANSHTGFVTGEPHLVGFSPGGGPSINSGSIDLATQLPVTTSNTQLTAISMSASPSPISTPAAGSVVNYTISNAPEFAPGSGVYVGLHIISTSQLPAPGVDLGIIGAPGCPLLVGGLDVILAQVGVSPTIVSPLTLPAGLAIGLQLFNQGAAMFLPFSLPNGQNAFGVVTSNGVASTIGAW